eukprot:GILJ01009106.1.p1 GENE.GILJ01009106.1~~GILJ01009106.1.p1  ORF type:complete len:341 (-),score=42.12 GILJ01009106.1:124-1101(-)
MEVSSEERTVETTNDPDFDYHSRLANIMLRRRNRELLERQAAEAWAASQPDSAVGKSTTTPETNSPEAIKPQPAPAQPSIFSKWRLFSVVDNVSEWLPDLDASDDDILGDDGKPVSVEPTWQKVTPPPPLRPPGHQRNPSLTKRARVSEHSLQRMPSWLGDTESVEMLSIDWKAKQQQKPEPTSVALAKIFMNDVSNFTPEEGGAPVMLFGRRSSRLSKAELSARDIAKNVILDILQVDEEGKRMRALASSRSTSRSSSVSTSEHNPNSYMNAPLPTHRDSARESAKDSWRDLLNGRESSRDSSNLNSPQLRPEGERKRIGISGI